MMLEVDQEQVRVLKRALEARVRDMQLRLGGEPGDDGFRRELRISIQLLRHVEALERQAGLASWVTSRDESEPEDDASLPEASGSRSLCRSGNALTISPRGRS